MYTRRHLIKRGTQASLSAITAPLWSGALTQRAVAQLPASGYKAIVIITLGGGNDANNMIVPISTKEYAEYANIRGGVALSASSLHPLQNANGSTSYGLHPALSNIAILYNQQRAAVVANAGPLTAPVTKAGLLAGTASFPDSLFSHPDGVKQWESASAYNDSLTGWGGRLADILLNNSGNLPPVLNGGLQSLFTVGQTVQAVDVQSGGFFKPLSAGLQAVINTIAQTDANSQNHLVAQAATIRLSSLKEQAILNQAQTYRTLTTAFPGDGFGSTMHTIAQLIAGRSVVGATRQIFYTQQGSYDTHAQQLSIQAANLQSLDAGLGAFFNALDEIGMSQQVLVCTHSDFNRTCTPNTSGGSDHAWGSHQLILGGGIKGGQVFGTMPILELNGPDEWNGLGIWIPTTSVAQLAGGIGRWMGLTTQQLASVFPELKNFPAGALHFS